MKNTEGDSAELVLEYKTSRIVFAEEEEEEEARLVVSLRDVTESRRAEQRIRELAALLEKTQDAIYVRDMDQRITYWNRGAERLYGWTADEVLGKRVVDLLYHGDSPEIQKIRETVIEKGEWMGEVRQFTKSGREVTVQSRRTLLRDLQGKPHSTLNINTDITEKKQIEAQFLRAQRMESIGTLASGVAHDLNNILAPILMGLQLFRMRFNDDASVKLIDTMDASAQRGASIVQQILSFARGISSARAIVQIKHLIVEQLKICRETFPPSIQIQKQIDRELWPVFGDATQLHQVLMNLCVNARDAMPKGGTLRVEARNSNLDDSSAAMHPDAKPGLYIVLTVADTGIGMPAHILDRIFDPFFTTKECGKGTGLGLSTALGIVKNHGGFIDVSSQEGRGTEFKIYLPAAPAGTARQIEAKQRVLPAGNNELVLVIDDEESIREITKTILESNGYRVLTASDGTAAIVAYAHSAEQISVVITDLAMPYLDGPATIRAMRQINPNVKIIAMSGMADSANITEFTESKCFAFLHKPFTAETLVNQIHEILNGRIDM